MRTINAVVLATLATFGLSGCLVEGCGAHKKKQHLHAEVVLTAAGNHGIKGKIILDHDYPDPEVRVRGTVSGLTVGKHGLHIHETGDISNDCKLAGGHFNPYNKNHGAPDSSDRHVGDLGNIEVTDAKSATTFMLTVSSISLKDGQKNTVNHRTIVIDAGEDDYSSTANGNAGARVACGVITPKSGDLFLRTSAELVAVGSNGLQGTISLEQTYPNTQVQVNGFIYGLSAGKYGVSIHTNGDVGNDCKNVGGHFNPHNKKHGSPKDTERHVGDLGITEAKTDASGLVAAIVDIKDSVISLKPGDKNSVIKRAIVIHTLGGNKEKKVACGVIEIPPTVHDGN